MSSNGNRSSSRHTGGGNDGRGREREQENGRNREHYGHGAEQFPRSARGYDHDERHVYHQSGSCQGGTERRDYYGHDGWRGRVDGRPQYSGHQGGNEQTNRNDRGYDDHRRDQYEPPQYSSHQNRGEEGNTHSHHRGCNIGRKHDMPHQLSGRHVEKRRCISEQEPMSTTVLSNCYPLEIFRADGMDTSSSYMMYSTQIQYARRMKKIDPNKGEPCSPIIYEVVPQMRKDGSECILDIEKGIGPLAKRVLDTVIEEQQKTDTTFFFVLVGNVAYAPKRLFSICCETDAGKSSSGSGTSKARVFAVKAKRSCDENDKDASLCPDGFFLVKLTEIGEVLGPTNNAITGIDYVQQMQQLYGAVMRSIHLFLGMSSLGSSSGEFLIRNEMSRATRSRVIQGVFRKDSPQALVEGIKIVARVCQNGRTFAIADSVTEWVHREETNDGRSIPLLDPIRKTIAGVRIYNTDKPITDSSVEEAIVSALKDMVLDVKFTRPLFERERKAMVSGGKSEAEILAKKVVVRKNTRLTKHEELDVYIIWDPSKYTFPAKDGKQYTVCEFFTEVYKYTLRFPHMPIISVKVGKHTPLYPTELFLQGLSKVKGANEDHHRKPKLDYCDENGGVRRVDNINHLLQLSRSMSRLGLGVDDVLGMFRLRMARQPLTLPAQILPAPILMSKEEKLTIRDGSWNAPRIFPKPAKIYSYAVVECGTSNSQSMPRSSDMIHNILRECQASDIQLPDCIQLADAGKFVGAALKVTERTDGFSPAEIIDGHGRGIRKARNYFLYDASHHFRDNNTWHRTQVSLLSGMVPDEFVGTISECLVVPLPSSEQKEVGIMLPEEIKYETHRIESRHNHDQVAEARVMVEISIMEEGEGEVKYCLDPFLVRYDESTSSHQALRSGKWAKVKFLRKIYVIRDKKGKKTEAYEEDLVPNPTPLITCNESAAGCPQFVFSCLPQKDSEVYYSVKMATRRCFDVASQCMVESKYNGLRNDRQKRQYCKGIALKLNTKLMNSLNRSRVWDTFHTDGQRMVGGIPWVCEAPTAVIGVKSSKGLGQDSIEKVVFSISVDDGCMPIYHHVVEQPKSEVLSGPLLKDAVKNLIQDFVQHTTSFPKRMLFIRADVSESSEERIKSHEIPLIRKAIYELLKTANPGFNCPNIENCNGEGCLCCTIPITFIAPQTLNVPRVTPDPSNRSISRSRNVLSGTCVDHTITTDRESEELKDLPVEQRMNLQLFPDTDEYGFDFLLVPHGGPKGTSKPVVYRTLWNENYFVSSGDGTTQLSKVKLARCVYHMSFQYGTASKAVRSIPVINYSKRLAEQVMGYANTLRRGTLPAFGPNTQQGDALRSPLCPHFSA